MLSTLSTLMTADSFAHVVHIVHTATRPCDLRGHVHMTHKAFRIRLEGEGVGPNAKGLL